MGPTAARIRCTQVDVVEVMMLTIRDYGHRFVQRSAIVVAALVIWSATSGTASATLSVTAPNGATRTIDASGNVTPAPGTGANDDPFFKQVQDCLDELDSASKLGVVQSLVASGNAHTIVKETNENKGSTCTAPIAGGFRAGDGTPGAGAGSSTRWQPTNTAAFPNGQYTDGTPRDPCGALLHELVHAVDADEGKLSCDYMNTNVAGTQRVLVDEVRAVQLQNWFHQWKGKASRTQYGGQQLPAGIIFNKCPSSVTIDDGVGGFTAIDIYYEIPVTGTGKANNSSVDGREVPVGTDGTVKFRKNLDGTVTVCLNCLINPVSIVSIRWAANGGYLGPADDFGGSPLLCDALTGKVESTRPVPAPPSLKVSKYPEEQQVDENGNITFTISVMNTGTQALNNVMVFDNLFPAGNYTIPALAAGATHTQQITFNVGAGTGRRTNIASAQGQTAGGLNAQSNDDASFTVQ